MRHWGGLAETGQSHEMGVFEVRHLVGIVELGSGTYVRECTQNIIELVRMAREYFERRQRWDSIAFINYARVSSTGGIGRVAIPIVASGQKRCLETGRRGLFSCGYTTLSV